MNLTVSAVQSWNPDALRITADRIDRIVDRLDDRMKGLLSEQDVLAERWTGDAARSAAERIVRERSLGSAIAGALLEVGGAYRTGASIVEGARMHLLATLSSAEQSGFTVHDDGTVDPSEQIALLAILVPDSTAAAGTRSQVERCAADLTRTISDAIHQASRAAAETTDRIDAAVNALEVARDAAMPGKVVQQENGEFSWTPDWAATTAASTIGSMADGTKVGLGAAAATSGDDLARGVARGLGPAGVVLGVIPAIVNDIEGGMDPTRAVVTEGSGAAAGYLASAWAFGQAGAVLGTGVAPGVGTAVGLSAGIVAGAFGSYLVSKSAQWLWK